MEKPYDKRVDLWSIGIIQYLLLSGCLPFDDENSEKEIARQTIHDETPFPSSLWKKISLEAKSLVQSKKFKFYFINKNKDLLHKNPEKRLTINEILEHPWIQKYQKINLKEKRRTGLNESIFEIYSKYDETSNDK